MSGLPLYSIPFHRAFADALAVGLLHRFGSDPLELARGLILLPNNRAIRALTDAFVRRAAPGLLLPRLVSIGDPALDEGIGAALDPLDAGGVPPAIAPLERQLILARLIEQARAAAGDPAEPTEAIRLAADLGRALDQLIVEEVPLARLADAVPIELAEHWQASLDILQTILGGWHDVLRERGRIDLAERRNRLIDATTRRWAIAPPESFVCVAGIGTAGPAVGRLLHRVARLPTGLVVFAGLDRALPDDQWDALDPGAEDGRPLATHPQFALRQLLDRIGAGRGEVRNWPRGGVGATSPARSRAIAHAMTAAAFTDRWEDLPTRAKCLSGVTAAVLANPAAEAQAIALALRERIETPGRTAALVTPDRGLAVRVAAHLARWGIVADDSAGRPLALTPPGTLLLAAAEALAQDFAPVPLLALLKHPLVRAGEGRIAWLDGVRRLDRALRGPRPAARLDGITRHLADEDPRAARERAPARDWWAEARVLLAPLASLGAARGLAPLAAGLRAAVDTLAGEEAWRFTAGRAAADLIAALEASVDGPRSIDPLAFPAVLRALLDQQSVRPPQGGHPRVFIWGLIEARLQQADLVVLGGLNEGVWPAAPAPDPWLAPAVRRALGLPGLERRIGIEAHEFASALGAPEVLLTRARRDARAPAVASRFWLRLEAMTGGIVRHPRLARWAEALDRPADFAPAERPAPAPPAAERPRRIAVTKLDRLKADPFAFYADQMLRLRPWDAVDADPGPAWRGTAVHKVFELWIRDDGCDPAALRARVEAMLAETAAHPVVATLWTPRLLEAIDWVAAEVAADRAAGRVPAAVEATGRVPFGAIELQGTADRIDRLPDGRLAIVDYKTGQPPSRRAVEQGYAMQLGLLGLIAERGGFGEVPKAETGAWEYWSLAAKKGTLGHRDTPAKRDNQGRGVAPEDFVAHAARVLEDAVATWLTGDAPFTAKLHPEYAPYADYDQLMRLDEWYGRGASSPLPPAGGVGGGDASLPAERT